MFAPCTSAPVISGVPQGTVLGPILFILYINDLELVLSHSRSSSFADDTRLSGSISNVEDTVKLQADLNTVVDWSKKNNTALHEDKFELMSYRTHSSRLLRVLPFADEFCEYDTPAGCTLSPTKTVKDLGVYLSSEILLGHITSRQLSRMLVKSRLGRSVFLAIGLN